MAVLVFDARMGDLLSANNEARRMVGDLKAPGRSLNQLLELIALRRPDGSDIPIDELPTMKVIRTGESVLADGILKEAPMELHVNNGQFVVLTGEQKLFQGIDWQPWAGEKATSITPEQAMELVAAISSTATNLGAAS